MNAIQEAKERWKRWLLEQVGYHEEGDNLTKYARDYDYDTRLYGFDMEGKPWCDWFSDLAYCVCFGFEIGAKMTYQWPSGSAACKTSASFYQQNDAWYHTPEVGDQVFFYYSGDINHVESVIEVNGGRFTTVGGNSSDMVKKNEYSLGDPKIAGFGRPNWYYTLKSLNKEDSKESENANPKISPDEKSTNQNGNPDCYTIVKGDTLWGIAQKFLGNGMRYPEIKELNGLTSDLIFPGQMIKLPKD